MKNDRYLLPALLITVIIFFIAVVVYSGSIKYNANHTANTNTAVVECERDADCLKAGCSNQLCLPRDKAAQAYSTCEWRDEYSCYERDNCLCQDKKCQWQQNQQFAQCMTNLQKQ